VIREPAAPEYGDRSLITGRTVNKTPLLNVPLSAFTTTLPVEALLGTIAVMLVSFQEFTVAAKVPNVTVPVAWVAPKFNPAIVTVIPAAPLLELREVMVWQVPRPRAKNNRKMMAETETGRQRILQTPELACVIAQGRFCVS
jgi:hypothetical protein